MEILNCFVENFVQSSSSSLFQIMQFSDTNLGPLAGSRLVSGLEIGQVTISHQETSYKITKWISNI